jgi:hypothetical protein
MIGVIVVVTLGCAPAKAIEHHPSGSSGNAIPAKALRDLPLSSGGAAYQDQGRHMSDVPLPAAMRQYILDELVGVNVDPNDLPDVESETVLSRFEIGPKRTPVLRVQGHGPQACGATGNCSILFLDTITGAVILAGNGWKIVTLRPVRFGGHDLAILHNMSACSGLRDEYRFDGRRYRLITESETKTPDCP